MSKMRALVLLGLALVASASALVEVQTGYHQAVGIPTAERIKAYEDQLFADGARSIDNDRIIGGAIAPVNAHPYFAGLLISLVNVAGNSVCGSSLLSANRLVTAAHCWFDGVNQAWQFVVILGTPYLFTGGTRIATSSVILHPQWTPSNLNNDIAMILLPTNVAFSNAIQPIDIPNRSELWDQFTGRWLVAAGFGKTTDAQSGASTIVSHVSLQAISVAQCQATFGTNFVRDSTLCTSGAGGIGICSGDSGGPLVVQNYNGRHVLAGVSSFVAAAGCQLGFPSAFARITSFYDFVSLYL